jgi:hypothetical protein
VLLDFGRHGKNRAPVLAPSRRQRRLFSFPFINPCRRACVGFFFLCVFLSIFTALIKREALFGRLIFCKTNQSIPKPWKTNQSIPKPWYCYAWARETFSYNKTRVFRKKRSRPPSLTRQKSLLVLSFLEYHGFKTMVFYCSQTCQSIANYSILFQYKPWYL